MKLAIYIACIFMTIIVNSQKRSAIDSVNNISYDTKIKNAAILPKIFHKNAANAKKIGYQLGEADSYSNLGLIYYYQGKYSENVTFILKAIRLYDLLGNTTKQAHEYAGLGYSMKRRNMPRALYYMQKGKAIAEANNLKQPLLSIYNNYGVLKEMSNDLDSALYFYEKGLILKERLHDSLGIPYSLNNIAGIYVMQGKYSIARELYARALTIRIKIKDEIGIAENFTYLGDFHTSRNEYREALRYYEKSLERASKYHYIDLIRSNYKNIASTYEMLGENRLALQNYKKYTDYKDSLLNKETNSKIAELEIQFESNNKEKLLAQNRNMLLIKEAEVKQRNSLLKVLSLVSIFILITGYLIYRQQKLVNSQMAQEHELKSAIAVIETQNKLQEQRLGISRDLHDNIGAQLTFIISSVDNLRYAFDITNTKLDHKLSSISTFTSDTIIELRDTIWAMNNNEISFEDLRSRILNFIEKAKEASTMTTFRFQVDDNLNSIRLTSIQGMNIYRTIQEALNNALKYSSAKTIAIDITPSDNGIAIKILDDGNGFDVATVPVGNGIGNMKKRMESIGASFTMDAHPGNGVKINIIIPDITTKIT